MTALPRHAVFLAVRSLRHSWRRSLLLALVLGLSLGVPLALTSLLERASTDMRARAAVSPLVLGAKGSESDLMFGALFFAATPPRGLSMQDLARIEGDGLGQAVPIALGATAQKTPVVGTTIDSFDRRGVRPTSGTMFATIGECVAGADAARALGLAPGSRLYTDPASLSDLAGVYPLELTVTGILPPTGTPDDGVLFVDLRTMWSIRGLGHRHDDPAASASPGALIGQDGERTIAGEALAIERKSAGGIADDFHFHGDPATFPIDAALVYPGDAKAQAILLGRFTGKDETLQLARPDQFIERVLERIFGVGRILGAVAVATAVLVMLVAALAFALSIRLRADELALMRRLGASRGRVAMFLTTEAALLLAGALAITATCAVAAPLLAPLVMRMAAG
jgi:putative ABC transport system permease protein